MRDIHRITPLFTNRRDLTESKVGKGRRERALAHGRCGLSFKVLKWVCCSTVVLIGVLFYLMVIFDMTF